MTPPRTAETGFTLVEVMVALLIFGMLAAAGVAILSFSIRAQAATGTRLDTVSAFNRTVSLLSSDLGQATNRATRDESGTAVPGFVGDSGGDLRFVRTGWSNVDGAPRASVQKVAYRLDGGVLQRLAYPMLDGAAPLPPTALLVHIRRITARYRFRGAWSDRWDGSQGAALPDAVELTVERDDARVFRTMMLVGAGYAPPPEVANAPL